MIKVTQNQIQKPSSHEYEYTSPKTELSRIVANAIFGGAVSIGLGLLAIAQAIETEKNAPYDPNDYKGK